MTNTDLLDRVFVKQSPSDAWKIAIVFCRDQLVRKSMVGCLRRCEDGKGRRAHAILEPCRRDCLYFCFAWCDRLEGDVNRKLVRVLTDDYEIEQRTPYIEMI